MAQQQKRTATEEAANSSMGEGTIPAAVADDNGQSTTQAVPAARAAGTVAPMAVAAMRYTTQEGTEAGNTAPRDYYVDDATGKLVTEQPERGTLLARKGGEVTPAAARMIADAQS